MKNTMRNKLLFLLLVVFFTLTSINIATIGIQKAYNSGSPDLRNRIVGARLLKNDKDPYVYLREPNDGDRLTDPYSYPYWYGTRVTVPPTIISLHTFWADQDYVNIVLGWFFVQWILMILSITLLVLASPKHLKSITLVTSMFFMGSYIFLYNLVPGQIYVLYTFLLSLSVFLMSRAEKSKHFEVLSGITLGFLASIRLPYLLLSIPFLIKKHYSIAKPLTYSFVGFLAFSLLTYPSQWFSYLLAMGSASKYHYQNTSAGVRHFYPDIVEGLPFAINSNVPVFETSLKGIFRVVFGISLSPVYYLILILFVIICISYFVRKHLTFKKSDLKQTYTLLLVGVTTVMAVEVLLPVPRNLYNDIQLLIPISLVIFTYKKDGLPNKWIKRGILIGIVFILLALTRNIIPFIDGTYSIITK